jgi:hypothetical protein
MRSVLLLAPAIPRIKLLGPGSSAPKSSLTRGGFLPTTGTGI